MSHASPLGLARLVGHPTPERTGLADLVSTLRREDADARRTWTLLSEAGLVPLTAFALERAGLLGSAGDRTRQALQAHFEANALRNGLLRREAVDATRRLTARGIPVLWMKGLWLAHYVYERPALRTMADVDLLVPNRRRQAATACLLEAGFSRDPLPDAAGLVTLADSLFKPGALPGGDGAVHVDLHDRLHLSSTISWADPVVWDHATHTRPSGVPVALPSPETGLLIIAAHTLKHAYDRRHAMVAVVDALTILTRCGGALDLAWLEARLAHPLEATAMYMLLASAGEALPAPGNHLLDIARRRAEQLDTLAMADRILRVGRDLGTFKHTDFSLLETGQRGSAVGRLVDLVRGAMRWRRRVGVDVRDGGAGRSGLGLLSLLTRANWRYAYASYLAGRLARSVAKSSKVE